MADWISFLFFIRVKVRERFNTIPWEMAKSIFQTFLDNEIFLLYFLGDNTEKAKVSGTFEHRVTKFEEEIKAISL